MQNNDAAKEAQGMPEMRIAKRKKYIQCKIDR
jgi:hypothetical protein